MFRDLVHRAARPQDKVPEMKEDRWRRMLREASPGLDLEGAEERGRKPRVRILRELLHKEGWYRKGTGGTAMARRRAERERIRTGSKMQSPAPEGCKEDGRTGAGGR